MKVTITIKGEREGLESITTILEEDLSAVSIRDAHDKLTYRAKCALRIVLNHLYEVKEEPVPVMILEMKEGSQWKPVGGKA